MQKGLGVMMLILPLFFNCAANSPSATEETVAQAPEQKSAQPTEKEIPEKYRWDLTDIYATNQDWEKAKEAVVQEFDKVLEYEGKLNESPQMLLECLALNSRISKEISRLYSYTSMHFDQNMRVSEYQAMKQEISQLATDYNSKASFIEPEILKMSAAKIEEFIGAEPGLKDFEFNLKDLMREKEHYLSQKEEKIIAEAGLMSGSAASISTIFRNADFPYPTIVLSDGSKVYLDNAAYVRYRSTPNREDREKVFDAFFNKINDFRRTWGTQLYSNINSDLFYKRVRKYESCLETSLSGNNIPTEVYHKLIENVNNNLDTFHRYLQLRQRIMDVDTLKYFDIYAPVVKGLQEEYTYEEAQKLILDAIAPLGKKYQQTVKKAFDERWIDVFPVRGKRSGAYSNGSIYDVHPYILLNWTDHYDDVSTLAHELGHTMHSYFSNKNQPYPTSRYSIFVAEVASTFNENLLFHDYLEKIDDDDKKLTLLMEFLDGIKGTLFRQTKFAEFELKIHEMVENGEQLTGDVMNKLYHDLVRRYYGHDQGICVVPNYIDAEWAYIPHFYYNFYVYQYSTSYTASTALAKKVRTGDGQATQKYLNFLSAGGSDYPINILKKAGVDMTTDEPFELTMKEMNWAMDEIEKILDKKGM